MADFEEVSDEEKLKIGQHFLLSSPAGEFHEVLADVKKLLPEGLLTDPLATGIARAYNNKTGKIAVTPSGNKVVLCNASEVDPSHYFDPIARNVFGLDHLTMASVSDNIPFESDPALEARRAILQAEISKFIASRYSVENIAGSVFAKDGSIVVAISGEKANLSSFWSGRWASVWTLVLGSNSLTISGEAKVLAHYFEDGNLQLQSAKAFPARELNFSSDEAMAKAVVTHIVESENSLHEGLEQTYSMMNSNVLIAMRRVLPITKSKMEWNVNSVRMNRQLRK